MPENTLYWYGYNNGIEEGSTANGWANFSSSAYATSTWNTNYIQSPSGNNNNGQIGNTNAINDVSKYHCLYTTDNYTSGNPFMGTVTSKTDNNFSAREALSTVGSLAHYELASTVPYVMMFNSSNCNGKTYALWYE